MTWYYKLIGIGIIGAIIAGGLFATYESGVSAGKLTGDKAGYARAWTSQQTTIDALTLKYNALATATSDKTEQVEQLAATVVNTNQKMRVENNQKAAAILTSYRGTHGGPIINSGLSLVSVQAINSLLDLQ